MQKSFSLSDKTFKADCTYTPPSSAKTEASAGWFIAIKIERCGVEMSCTCPENWGNTRVTQFLFDLMMNV